MKRIPLFAPVMLAFLGLLGLLVAGYMPPTNVEAALQATETPASVDITANDGTPAEQATGEQPIAEATPIPDANCVTCHQNAEQLKLVAEEEVVQESLNEGSG